jgi:hypothetical protein
MIIDLSCATGPKGNSLAALALLVAMIDLLNSSGKLSDDEVTAICRNAQALLPDPGADADGLKPP